MDLVPFTGSRSLNFCNSTKLKFNYTMLLIEVKTRSYRIPSLMTVIFVLLPIIFMMVVSISIIMVTRSKGICDRLAQVWRLRAT